MSKKERRQARCDHTIPESSAILLIAFLPVFFLLDQKEAKSQVGRKPTAQPCPHRLPTLPPACFLGNLRALKQNVHKAFFILPYFFLIFKYLQLYPPKNRFKTNGSKGGLTQLLRSECDKMGRECDKMG
ncbi:MAG: hypothetical protein FWD09_04380 [Lentimicrobiaceae bacterium]|nr:hypothetical protein [Lentimicrobiaceae bacterium]